MCMEARGAKTRTHQGDLSLSEKFSIFFLFMLRPSHFPGEGRRWGEAWTVGVVAWNDMKNSERYKSKILLEHKDQGTE